MTGAMSGASAVSIREMSKRFRLHRGRQVSTVKDLFVRGGRAGLFSGEELWAIRELSLEVPRGRMVGIIGSNGSGKSTLLKLIGGILKPTAGSIRVEGRVSALIELGAGFHPEFTGRENIQVNGILLGLSRAEIRERFEDIVAFAGLEPFIDNPVKTYSSGMYMRLGFAIAVTVDPDILLIDEVLAVGDEAFQRKCIRRVRDLQAAGRTIVFVTHAVQQVHQICDGAVMLDHGRIRSMGDVAEVIREYRLAMARRHIGFAREQLTRHMEVTAVETLDAEGHRPTSVLQPGAGMRVQVEVRANRPVDDPVVSLAIFEANGEFVWRTGTADMQLGRVEGKLRVEFNMISLPLQEGRYFFTVGIHDRSERVVHDLHDQRYPFDVSGSLEDDNRVFIPVGTKVEPL